MQIPAILTPGAYWENTNNNIYRLVSTNNILCWVYDCKGSFHERWGVSYAGPYDSEEFPRDTFANISEAMRYAETALLFKNT